MSRNDKSAVERQQYVLAWLMDHESIMVSDISSYFGVSEVTARRDLELLEQAGEVKRIHGGAISHNKSLTLKYPEQKVNHNVEAKEAIGKAAAQLVNDGDVIIADIGTTSFYFVKHLTNKKNITIITGDLVIANFASYNLPGAEILLLGGLLRKGYLYVRGSLTLSAMSNLYADKAFLSADGYDKRHGFTVEHDFSTTIKRAYISNSKQHIMLLDSSKYERTSFYHFADLSDFDICIVDAQRSEYIRQHADNTSAEDPYIGASAQVQAQDSEHAQADTTYTRPIAATRDEPINEIMGTCRACGGKAHPYLDDGTSDYELCGCGRGPQLIIAS